MLRRINYKNKDTGHNPGRQLSYVPTRKKRLSDNIRTVCFPFMTVTPAN